MDKTTVALVNAAVSALEKKMKLVEEKINLQPPTDGRDGKDGRNGIDGRNGVDGRDGVDGKDGSDGVDGVDGATIESAQVDLDGHLTLYMSDGNEIDAGDLTTVWERSDRLVQIIRGSGGSGLSDQVRDQINQSTTDIEDLQARQDQDDLDNANQNDRLTDLEANDATQDTDIDNLQTEQDAQADRLDDLEANDAVQDGRLDSVEAENATQNGRLDAVETENATQNDRLDAVESDNATQAQQISDLQTENDTQNDRLDDVEAANTQQDNRLDAVESENDTQNNRLDAVEDENATQNNRLDALETNDAIQDADIDALQANDTVQDNRLTSLESNDAVQDGRLDTLEANDAVQDAAISDLQDQVGKGIRAVFNNNQTIQATPTPLSFDIEQYNTDTEDFTLNANGTITVNTAGLYLLTAGVVISPAVLSAVGESSLIVRVNGNGVAAQTAEGTLDIGTTRALSACTAIQLEAGDVVDATASATSILGIGNILSLLLPFLLGINAQQINHLSISRL